MELLFLAAQIVILVLIVGVLLEEQEPEYREVSIQPACGWLPADQSQYCALLLLIR